MIVPLERYYPLTPGRTLLYRYSDPQVPEGAARRTCLTRRDLGAALVGRFEERIEGGTYPQVRSFDATASILGLQEGERWILREPLAAGARWQDPPDAYELAALEDSVTVPAGTFKRCLRVVYANEDIGGGILWLEEGVGLVKAEQYGERGPYLFELTGIVP